MNSLLDIVNMFQQEKLTVETYNKYIEIISQQYDACIYIYCGPLNISSENIINDWRKNIKNSRKNILFVLSTYGGSPDVAFKIGNILQQQVKKTDGQLLIYVPNCCKSAGTLLCMASNKLLMSDIGELGPLDIQIRTKDELNESYSSGVTPLQSFASLRGEATECFKHQLMGIATSAPTLSAKMIADIATNLTIGLLGPLYAHLDPLQIGESYRRMMIGKEYGERLAKKSKNISIESIQKLLFSYPDHGFAICFDEAKLLFDNVEYPTKELECLIEYLNNPMKIWIQSNIPTAIELCKILDKKETVDETQPGDECTRE